MTMFLSSSTGFSLCGFDLGSSPDTEKSHSLKACATKPSLLRRAIQVFHAQRFKFGAKAVDVQAEFPGLQLFAVSRFLGQSLFTRADHFSGFAARGDHYSIGIGHDDVAGM